MTKDLEDAEWNNIKQGKYLTLQATDDKRFQNPQIQEFYSYAYTKKRTKFINQVLLTAQKICKENNFDLQIPIWESKDSEQIKEYVLREIQKHSHFTYEQKFSHFLELPDTELQQLALKTQKNKQNLIVRYDYAHALRLSYYLNKKNIPYKFYHPPGIDVKKEVDITKKLLSVSYLLR